MSTNAVSPTPLARIRVAANPGWKVWNYSKDFSRGSLAARVARRHTESCRLAHYWPEKDLVLLEELTARLEYQARQGIAGWGVICATSAEYSSSLQTSRGVVQIAHDHELLQLLRDIFVTSRDESYWELLADFKDVLVRVERHHLSTLEVALNRCTPEERSPLESATSDLRTFVTSLEPHEHEVVYLWPIEPDLDSRVCESRSTTPLLCGSIS
jgi:hypothetical protein